MEKIIENMQKRNFQVWMVNGREEAKEKVLNLIPKNSTVGWGGSVTLEECGIIEELLTRHDLTLLDRSKGENPEEVMNILKKCLNADVFLASANALLEDGRLINIDGNGNRIAACIFPPKKVIFVVGKNKIVSGGIEDALERIRSEACPKNAERLDRNLPCRKTGKCHDCRSEQRMCGSIVIHEWARWPQMINIILVNENLGY